MESDNTDSLDLPGLRISQGFDLPIYLTSGKIEGNEMRLELVIMRTNILFCSTYVYARSLVSKGHLTWQHLYM